MIIIREIYLMFLLITNVVRLITFYLQFINEGEIYTEGFPEAMRKYKVFRIKKKLLIQVILDIFVFLPSNIVLLIIKLLCYKFE